MPTTIDMNLNRASVIDTTPEDERVAREVEQALMRSKWEAEEQMTPMPFSDVAQVWAVMIIAALSWVYLARGFWAWLMGIVS